MPWRSSGQSAKYSVCFLHIVEAYYKCWKLHRIYIISHQVCMHVHICVNTHKKDYRKTHGRTEKGVLIFHPPTFDPSHNSTRPHVSPFGPSDFFTQKWINCSSTLTTRWPTEKVGPTVHLRLHMSPSVVASPFFLHVLLCMFHPMYCKFILWFNLTPVHLFHRFFSSSYFVGSYMALFRSVVLRGRSNHQPFHTL